MNGSNFDGKYYWTFEREVKLIEEFRLKECLWNHKLKKHQKRGVKQLALEDIALKMGPPCTVEAVQARLKTLKDYYTSQKRAMKKKSGAAGGPSKPVKWVHYNSMNFLADTCEADESESNLTRNQTTAGLLLEKLMNGGEPPETESSENEGLDEADIDAAKSNAASPSISPNGQDNAKSSAAGSSTSPNGQDKTSDGIDVNKINRWKRGWEPNTGTGAQTDTKKKKDQEQTRTDLIARAVSLLEKESQVPVQNVEEDEISIFMKFLEKKVRKMDNDAQIRFQKVTTEFVLNN